MSQYICKYSCSVASYIVYTNIISINMGENIRLSNSVLSTPKPPLSFSLLPSFCALWHSKKHEKIASKTKVSTNNSINKMSACLGQKVSISICLQVGLISFSTGSKYFSADTW